MNRTILVASFISPDKLDLFLNLLETKFNIKSKEAFIFKNLDDESKIIVTYKLVLIDGNKIDLNKHFPNATIIHKKGNAIYTINALNSLIELESGVDKGNINYKDYTIDWSKYQNKMILTNREGLIFINIQRLFS